MSTRRGLKNIRKALDKKGCHSGTGTATLDGTVLWPEGSMKGSTTLNDVQSIYKINLFNVRVKILELIKSVRRGSTTAGGQEYRKARL
jgi:hypothetical protein